MSRRTQHGVPRGSAGRDRDVHPGQPAANRLNTELVLGFAAAVEQVKGRRERTGRRDPRRGRGLLLRRRDRELGHGGSRADGQLFAMGLQVSNALEQLPRSGHRRRARQLLRRRLRDRAAGRRHHRRRVRAVLPHRSRDRHVHAAGRRAAGRRTRGSRSGRPVGPDIGEGDRRPTPWRPESSPRSSPTTSSTRSPRSGRPGLLAVPPARMRRTRRCCRPGPMAGCGLPTTLLPELAGRLLRTSDARFGVAVAVRADAAGVARPEFEFTGR